MARMRRWQEALMVACAALFISAARAWPLGTRDPASAGRPAYSRLVTGITGKRALGIELAPQRPYVRLFRASLAPVAMPLAAGAYVAMAGTAGAPARRLSPRSFAVSHSIVVVGPNSPLFQTLLQRDFPGVTQVSYFQQVEPLLAIIHNNTQRVVKAFVIKWTITNADGTTSTATLPVIWYPPPGDPDLPGSATVLGRGGTGLGTELVSPFSQFGWARQRFPALLRGNVSVVAAVFQDASLRSLTSAAQNASSVQVTLDGAIFGDGVCVGPDTSKLFERFEAVQKARVDEANWALGELKTGLTNQQLRDALSEQIFKGRDATATDNASLYTAARGEAASRLLSMLNAVGQQALQRFSLGWASQRPMTLERQAGQ